MANVYQMVTDRITEQLTKGIIPWQRPWTGVGAEDGGSINYVSRRPYSVLNQLLLGRPGEWLTWNQIKDLGGKLKKGAKAGIVVFYKNIVLKGGQSAPADAETEDTQDGGKRISLLRYYNVFHLEDVEGISRKITPGEPRPAAEPIEAAETVIAGYVTREAGLRFQNDKPSNRAYYAPGQDLVVVPMHSQYTVPEEYYSTAFHELTHSTMPESRCDRKAENVGAHFGNSVYSREELVAEIGSAMLCNRVGISCERAFRNSVAYIQSWLEVLKNDNRMIVWAASRAERAAKYILNETEA